MTLEYFFQMIFDDKLSFCCIYRESRRRIFCCQGLIEVLCIVFIGNDGAIATKASVIQITRSSSFAEGVHKSKKFIIVF